jgi:hypothetical protein
MQHQSPEYDSVPAESNERVSLSKWRVVLAGFIGTIAAGIILVIVLANGAANPPRASALVFEANRLEQLEFLYEGQDSLLYKLPFELDISSLYTLEVTANNTASDESAWGIWVGVAEHTPLGILVRDDGYFYTSDTGWVNFLHIQPISNKLYLSVENPSNHSLSSVAFRINDEIALEITPDDEILPMFGVALYKDAAVDFEYIRLYRE